MNQIDELVERVAELENCPPYCGLAHDCEDEVEKLKKGMAELERRLAVVAEEFMAHLRGHLTAQRVRR